jgi:hypothetical protein
MQTKFQITKIQQAELYDMIRIAGRNALNDSHLLLNKVLPEVSDKFEYDFRSKDDPYFPELRHLQTDFLKFLSQEFKEPLLLSSDIQFKVGIEYNFLNRITTVTVAVVANANDN